MNEKQLTKRWRRDAFMRDTIEREVSHLTFTLGRPKDECDAMRERYRKFAYGHEMHSIRNYRSAATYSPILWGLLVKQAIQKELVRQANVRSKIKETKRRNRK